MAQSVLDSQVEGWAGRSFAWVPPLPVQSVSKYSKQVG
jgi:hypothetical protein